MVTKTKTDIVVGGIVLLLSLAILFLWIPADIETGIFEKVRGRTQIGDSFAPVVASSILALGGLLLIVEAIKRPGNTRLSAQSVLLSLGLCGVFVVALTIMRWAGPAAVHIFADEVSGGYRTLRDTAPWKYIGFVAGGTFLVSAIISLVEHRLTFRALAIGLAATIIILLIYDFPFNHLVVPPNGDV